MAFVMPDMSFLYISFVILFCQNNVKKNCKFISRVFKKKRVLPKFGVKSYV